MATDLKENKASSNSNESYLEQKINGSRKISNYVIASMLSIGGIGFLVAALSSYLGKNLLPIGNPSSLKFVPQGLVMGLYGIVASMLACYLWRMIQIDFGSGSNLFDKSTGFLVLARRGYWKEIIVKISLNEIKAIKLEVREGINPRRRILLRIQGKKDIPITGVGEPVPLLMLEQEGAQLARFLEVNLEGLSS